MSVVTLGDPHLGRRFTVNVPLHRRGDRERMIVEHFQRHFAELDNPDFHVCMGDIFDRPVVSPADLKLVMDTYAQAMDANRHTTFILLAGNHDISRDLETVSSFDILATWAEMLPRRSLVVVKNEAVKIDDMLFCPWHPVKSAIEIARDCKSSGGVFPHWGITRAFGHWDVVNPKSDHNMVPALLPIERFITGHDHRKRHVMVGDKLVTVVGSMQPYAHGEDDGEMYRTVTLKELSAIPDTRNLCLRFILAEGEELPDVDCLQLSSITEESEEVTDLSVNLDGFDMASIFKDTLQAHGVSPSLTSNLFEKYRNHGQ